LGSPCFLAATWPYHALVAWHVRNITLPSAIDWRSCENRRRLFVAADHCGDRRMATIIGVGLVALLE